MKKSIFYVQKPTVDCIVANIGWQNQNLSLWGIKQGYKEAGDDLIKIVLEEGEKNNIRVLDTYIFPIMFLYRQSIEVGIKNIYYRAFRKIPDGGHDLDILWKNLFDDVIVGLLSNEELIKENNKQKSRLVSFNPKDIDFARIQSILKEMQKTDVSSDSKADVWRYLIDKNGTLYFNKNSYISYKKLQIAIDEVFSVLEYLYHVVSEVLSTDL